MTYMSSEAGTAARVLVVDDSDTVRMKLRVLIDAAEGLQFAEEAADGAEALDLAAAVTPDVVVLDLRMPGISGIQAAWKLGEVAPQAKILMLTVSDEESDIADAFLAGVSGYVVKGATDDEIVDAIRKVAAGEQVISPKVAAALVGHEPTDAARRDWLLRTPVPDMTAPVSAPAIPAVDAPVPTGTRPALVALVGAAALAAGVAFGALVL